MSVAAESAHAYNARAQSLLDVPTPTLADLRSFVAMPPAVARSLASLSSSSSEQASVSASTPVGAAFFVERANSELDEFMALRGGGVGKCGTTRSLSDELAATSVERADASIHAAWTVRKRVTFAHCR